GQGQLEQTLPPNLPGFQNLEAFSPGKAAARRQGTKHSHRAGAARANAAGPTFQVSKTWKRFRQARQQPGAKARDMATGQGQLEQTLPPQPSRFPKPGSVFARQGSNPAPRHGT